MRINKQGYFRPQGEDKFRSLSTAASAVGRAWCGAVDCFSGEGSRLRGTLLARWDKGYEEVWLIVTDLAPAQAARCGMACVVGSRGALKIPKEEAGAGIRARWSIPSGLNAYG